MNEKICQKRLNQLERNYYKYEYKSFNNLTSLFIFFAHTLFHTHKHTHTHSHSFTLSLYLSLYVSQTNTLTGQGKNVTLDHLSFLHLDGQLTADCKPWYCHDFQKNCLLKIFLGICQLRRTKPNYWFDQKPNKVICLLRNNYFSVTLRTKRIIV